MYNGRNGRKKHNENNDDKELDQYAAIIRKIAKELNPPLVDLRTAFKNYFVTNTTANLEKDTNQRWYPFQ